MSRRQINPLGSFLLSSSSSRLLRPCCPPPLSRPSQIGVYGFPWQRHMPDHRRCRRSTVRQQMEEQVAQKSSELEQYLRRVQELEEMYHRLQEALDDEKQARLEEESARLLQTRLLEEEATKRSMLEKLHQEQERTIKMTEAEKKELETIRETKERELQEAMQQLEQLERERMAAVEQYEQVKNNLEEATSKTRSWKDKVAQHEGLIRLIQPGAKNPGLVTNWGPASFTQRELEEREKSWQEKRSTSTD